MSDKKNKDIPTEKNEDMSTVKKNPSKSEAEQAAQKIERREGLIEAIVEEAKLLVKGERINIQNLMAYARKLMDMDKKSKKD